jgi:peptide/nickel transport system permease protein
MLSATKVPVRTRRPELRPAKLIALPSERRWLAWMRSFAAAPAGVLGALLVGLHVIAAMGAPYLAPFPPTEFHLEDVLQAPSTTYLFGTDQYGRDVFSRVLYGGRSALMISIAATALGLLAGGAIGMAAGYYGGLVDELLMRATDAMLAFPSLLLAMLILAMVGPNTENLILGIGLIFAPRVARVARSVTLDLCTREYVAAARLRGESSLYILTREILPNALGPLIVEGSIRISYAILLVGTLGFLGLGVQPPSPDWGLTIAEARNFIAVAPWMVFFPAAAIASLVVGANLLADGLYRTLDPAGRRMRR